MHCSGSVSPATGSLRSAPRDSSPTIAAVTADGEEYHNVTGKIGFPFFPAFILDCLERTERAMTQAHCFKAAELCLEAQQVAESA